MSNSSNSRETSWEDTNLWALKDEGMEDGVDQPEVQRQVGLQFPNLDGYA